jgi:predicted nucleic acid-binding Zn ribbon protein
MTKRKENLLPLKDIITSLLRDPKLPFNPDDGRIWNVWEEAVGSAIAQHAQPEWIKSGKLRVRVSDPIWLQELGFVQETIKEKLNKRLGRKAVEIIEFRLGPSVVSQKYPR